MVAGVVVPFVRKPDSDAMAVKSTAVIRRALCERFSSLPTG
nr:hypothetical protein [Hydrogenophaga sp.]